MELQIQICSIESMKLLFLLFWCYMRHGTGFYIMAVGPCYSDILDNIYRQKGRSDPPITQNWCCSKGKIKTDVLRGDL